MDGDKWCKHCGGSIGQKTSPDSIQLNSSELSKQAEPRLPAETTISTGDVNALPIMGASALTMAFTIVLYLAGGVFTLLNGTSIAIFLLGFLIVVASSVWVAVDAHENQVRSSKHDYSIRNGALSWCVVCLILWIVGFPYYLFSRHRQLRQRGLVRSATLGSSVGLGVFGLGLLACVLTFAGAGKMSTTDLERQVRASMEADFSKSLNPMFQASKIQSFKLVHKQGNEYSGVLKCDNAYVAGGVTFTVDVTYDGKTLMWKAHQ